MTSHAFPETLAQGKNSVALWSNNPAKQLILFVHGFGGDPLATWNDMERLLPADARAAGADIVFYGYESTRSRILVHADRLIEFVDWLIAERGPYDRIVIAAHSLGAVVARRAILVAYRKTRPWIAAIRAVLFAPAHRGAAIQQLAEQSTRSGILSLFYALTLFRLQVLNDLKEDSAFLKDLKDDYARLMVPPESPPLLARVIFGRQDRIVNLLDFHPGEISESWEDHDHLSVCKPKQDVFLRPVDAVAEALQ